MAHPHHEHRQNKVEHERVGHITKACAKGGSVGGKGVLKKVLAAHKAEHAAMHADGGKSAHRMDRPHRAKGGRVKKHGNAKTIVNVITGHGGSGLPPAPPMAPPGPPMGIGPAAMPPPAAMAKPPMAPPMPPPGPGMAGPPMPMRAKGGRVHGKDGPAYREGIRAGTQVQHSDGKGTANRPENLNRGKPVTFASGGAVEAPGPGKGMGPDLEAGVVSGEARLKQAARARRNYAKA